MPTRSVLRIALAHWPRRKAIGHHPAILTEWGRVTGTLWTHKIQALHRNDFIMAAKIDSLTSNPLGALST